MVAIHSFLVTYRYITIDKTGSTLKNKIKNRIVNLCDDIVVASEKSGYGVALEFWEYWWESNEFVMNKGNCLLFGYEMTGDAVYRSTALSQLNYILGLNSLNKSFVMSHGTNYMMHPINCIYTVYGKAMPGWTAGGANSYIKGADVLLAELIEKGTPKAKCYLTKHNAGWAPGHRTRAKHPKMRLWCSFQAIFIKAALKSRMRYILT